MRHIKLTNKTILLPALVVLLFAVVLGVAWYFISESYQSSPIKEGHLTTGETYAGEDLAKSLDLRVAAKATYNSSSLKKYKDLGIINYAHRTVVSFAVPSDGLTEYGLMTTPLSKMPPRGYPVIILLHGYYNPQQYSTLTGFLNDMDFYSQHGFIVVKPDLRGQGLSAQAGLPEGAYYSMAYNTDIMSLISSLKHTNYIDKSSINLWGQSLGAYLALKVSVLSHDIKNTILLSGPVGEIQDMYKMYIAPSDQDNPIAYRVKQAAITKYGNPLTNPNFWENASPINFINGSSSFYQIHVGSDDKVVPPIFSKQLDDALTTDHKPHQYFVYPGGNHGLGAQRPDIWNRSLQLLQGAAQ